VRRILPSSMKKMEDNGEVPHDHPHGRKRNGGQDPEEPVGMDPSPLPEDTDGPAHTSDHRHLEGEYRLWSIDGEKEKHHPVSLLPAEVEEARGGHRVGHRDEGEEAEHDDEVVVVDPYQPRVDELFDALHGARGSHILNPHPGRLSREPSAFPLPG
jgi:hypothetical protein